MHKLKPPQPTLPTCMWPSTPTGLSAATKRLAPSGRNTCTSSMASTAWCMQGSPTRVCPGLSLTLLPAEPEEHVQQLGKRLHPHLAMGVLAVQVHDGTIVESCPHSTIHVSGKTALPLQFCGMHNLRIKHTWGLQGVCMGHALGLHRPASVRPLYTETCWP